MFGTFLVADGWFCSCVSDRGVFSVKFVRPHMKGAVEDLLRSVDKRAKAAEIGELSVVCAVSSCVLSQSEGISEFPGLGVAGAISGLFSGKSDNLRVRTDEKALCWEGTCGFVWA